SKTTYQHSIPSRLIDQNIHQLETKKDFEHFSKNYIEEQDVYLSEEEIHSTYSHSVSLFEKESDLLDTAIQEKLLKYIKFNVAYNSNHTPITNSILEFGNKFYHSFSDGFIPLSQVFNPYSGLKYSSIQLK
ncbi:hypothetical protein D0809_27165, partial [Flavobacterium circumlabens]